MNVRPIHLCLFATQHRAWDTEELGRWRKTHVFISFTAVMNTCVWAPTADFPVLWLLLFFYSYRLGPVPLRPDTDQGCTVPLIQAQQLGICSEIPRIFCHVRQQYDTRLCPCVGPLFTDEVSGLWHWVPCQLCLDLIKPGITHGPRLLKEGICIANDKEDTLPFFSTWMPLAYSHHRTERGDAGLKVKFVYFLLHHSYWPTT